MYPLYYTLVPAAFLLGFSMAVLWTAQATYLTNISACYAEISGKSLQNVVSKFNGLFFGIFGGAQIVGGIITATVLMKQDVGMVDVYHPPWPHIRGNETEPRGFSHVVNETGSLIVDQRDVSRVLVTWNMSTSGDDSRTSGGAGPQVVAPRCGVEYCSSGQPRGVSASAVDTQLLYTLLAIYGTLMIVSTPTKSAPTCTLCHFQNPKGVE